MVNDSQLKQYARGGGDVVVMADLAEFVQDLGAAASREAEVMANEVIQTMGAEVESLAQKYAPAKTGELRASIKREEGFMETRVYSDAPHAVYVEFGTWRYNELAPQAGTYEIKPVKAKALRFESGGKTVFAKSVKHPGVKAQPFMRPALNETVEDFTEGMADVGVYLIVGGA